ncbi:MAG: hypothetical protein CL933_23625 [Deltaproteobacteria bacterium]|nr:hypothetical protein [Deltaproteobacteria bacterium]
MLGRRSGERINRFRDIGLGEGQALRGVGLKSARAEPAAIGQGLNQSGSESVEPPRSLPADRRNLHVQPDRCSQKRTSKSEARVEDPPVDRSKV